MPSQGVPAPPDAAISTASALAYWDSVSPDVNGMLGGFPQISRIDLQGSANFVAKLRRLSPKTGGDAPLLARAVDCGAGIGRVTMGLLVNVAETVDIVEPVAKFTDQIARDTAFTDLRAAGKVGNVLTVGLEDWDLSAADVKYDLIWNQWCLGQLKDQQLISYLQRSKANLADNGWIVVKENMSTDLYARDIFDDTDSSVTRTDAHFRQIFAKAGLLIRTSELQRGFPKSLGLYPVRMYALRAG